MAVVRGLSGIVIVAVPTTAGSVVSRKCAGSLLVSVMFCVTTGGTLSPPPGLKTVLLPTMKLLRVIAGGAPTLIGAVIVFIPGEDTLKFAVPCVTPVTPKATLS